MSFPNKYGPYEGLHELDGVEQYSSEMRKLVYCSCWTELEKESVNLWAIYSELNGIRIKMKSTLFSETLSLQEIESGFIPVGEIEHIALDCVEYNENMKIKKVYGPLKIEYVDDVEKIYEHVVKKSIANEGTDEEFLMNDIFLEEVGIKKVRHWEYEHEWRYKTSPVKEAHGSNSAFTPENLNRLECQKYIDVPFHAVIEEILMGPNVSEKEENDLRQFLIGRKLETLLKRSEIKINIKKSDNEIV